MLITLFKSRRPPTPIRILFPLNALPGETPFALLRLRAITRGLQKALEFTNRDLVPTERETLSNLHHMHRSLVFAMAILLVRRPHLELASRNDNHFRPLSTAFEGITEYLSRDELLLCCSWTFYSLFLLTHTRRRLCFALRRILHTR